LSAKHAEINAAPTPLTIDTLAPTATNRGKREASMDNSELLLKVLTILRNKKAGKKVIKQFDQFRLDYEDTKKSFHLTFPESSDILESDGNRNQSN
jgi:hypothetical protein